MIYLERTILSMTVFWFITPSDAMARIAVVRVTMAEPEADGAAPATFEINILSAVLCAVSNSGSYERC